MTTSRRLWLGAVLALVAALLVAAFLLAIGQVVPARAEDQRLASISPKPAWIVPDPAAMLTRIGFGSCLDQKKPQPIWTDIVRDKPDLFVMMGDNVYGDARPPEMEGLFEAYRRQAAQPELAAARASIPFLSIWDDHDFGRNDGGSTFEGKRLAADAFHAFWQKAREPGRQDAIHYSRVLGPPGRRVQIIMLDTRFDRSDLTRKGADFPHWGPYGPDSDPGKRMLGEDQWSWLAGVLREPAQLRLLVSSVQVLAEGHGFERWGNLPRERERLLRLLAEADAGGIIILSGDRHHAAIYEQAHAGRRLVEVTSSALNISYGLGSSKDARVPPLVSDIYSGENYGTIDIDWAAGKATVAIKGLGGERHLVRDVSLAAPGVAR